MECGHSDIWTCVLAVEGELTRKNSALY